MVRFPKAKINIGLSITSKRADGFHNIESIFHPIGLCDILEAIPNSTGKFNLQLEGLTIAGKVENNLVFKAWEMLQTDFEIPGVDVVLHKIIPMGAGLGGGSADGSHMLLLLNDLFELKLTQAQLLDYALRLGSDCPFFIIEEPCFVSGRGEQMEQIDLDLTGKYIVIINPNIHIGTAEAYSSISPVKAQTDYTKLSKTPIHTWKDAVINDFEAPMMRNYPALEAIKQQLYSAGAIYASMTGSGSTMFGLFNEQPPNMVFDPSYFCWKGQL